MSSRVVRALLIGIGVVALVHGVVYWAVSRAFDRLPDRIVNHWGVDDVTLIPKADAFGFWMVSVPLTLLLAVVLVLVMRRLREGPRLIAGLVAGIGSFVPLTAGLATLMQAGTDVPPTTPGWSIPVAAVGAVLLGVVSSLLVGRPEPRPAAVSRPPLDRKAPTSWYASLSPSGAFLAILVLPLLLFVVLGATNPGLAPMLTGLGLVVAVVVLGSSLWRVRVDDRGIVARSVLGWPRLRWTLDEIERAVPEENINPIDYGGIGVRVTPGSINFVFSRGPGVRIELSDDTSVVITTDEARTAARIINARVAQSRTRA